jgi:molybdopterin-guanine dinucleotide biosynthesis protein A
MSGFPKGLLPHPGGSGTLIDHLASLGRRLGASVVLVGRADPYAHLGVPAIPDAFLDVGPIGGLAALLRYAHPHLVCAVACDMPHVNDALMARLLEAMDNTSAAVLPSRSGKLEPLCALYDPVRVLPVLERRVAKGWHGVQALAREVGAKVVHVPAALHGALDDWDAPWDVR